MENGGGNGMNGLRRKIAKEASKNSKESGKEDLCLRSLKLIIKI